MTGPQPLDRRVTSLEKDLARVVELLETLTGAVDDLTKNVNGAPPKKDPARPRWAWQHADQDQAAWLWAGLVPWVRWATDRYPTALRDLPPCWHLHGDAVEELTACGPPGEPPTTAPTSPGDDLIYWYDRWLPGTTSRLLGPTGILINCAKAKQHREPNLAGAPATSSTTPASHRRGTRRRQHRCQAHSIDAAAVTPAG